MADDYTPPGTAGRKKQVDVGYGATIDKPVEFKTKMTKEELKALRLANLAKGREKRRFNLFGKKEAEPEPDPLQVETESVSRMENLEANETLSKRVSMEPDLKYSALGKIIYTSSRFDNVTVGQLKELIIALE